MLCHKLQYEFGVTVVVTCHGPCPELNISVRSLLFQEHYYAGKPFAEVNTPLDIIISSDGKYEGPRELLDIKNVRLLENPLEGGVGHHTRGPGINIALNDWILLTNADNYYVSGWLDQVSKHMTDNVGVIYWDHINSLNSYEYFEARIGRDKIDLGCVMVRTEIAMTVQFPFRRYSGDFDYINLCAKNCLQSGRAIIKIKRVLFVHN